MSGNPYPKHHQLAQEARRTFRRKATPTEWSKLRDLKRGPCRCCGSSFSGLHHVVFRSHGGDDVAANLVPLCTVCHELVHKRDRETCVRLVMMLRDEEYLYAVLKCGEPVWERVYGVTYERP